MAKTLKDYKPLLVTDLSDSHLLYVVNPAAPNASADGAVSIATLKAYLGAVGGGTPTPPPPAPAGTVETPLISPAGGTVTNPTSVTISCATVGASIFYTTDGTTPTSASTPYIGPLSITATTTIKAIATKTGMNNSVVASTTYTISTSSGGSGTPSNPTGFLTLYGASVAEYPREYVSSRMPVRTGNLITVAAGGDLQAALNSAQVGDWVVLAAGATWTGNYTLPYRAGDVLSGGNNVIVVTTSAFASLPEKVRVTDTTPAGYFANLKNLSTTNSSSLSTAPGTSGWRIVGLNFTVDATVSNLTAMISIGTGDTAVQSNTTQTPKNIIVDRCRFDGHATLELRRAIDFEPIHGAVINSWFGPNIHAKFSDNQAICSWNTPGPLKIVNNYLQGSGEVVMFGGSPAVAGMASDIEFRYNTLTRPIGWKATNAWSVKNIFEIKKARRVLIEGNYFLNNWNGAQNGMGILLKHEPYGDESLGQAEDIIFKNNKLEQSSGGVNLDSVPGSNGGPLLYKLRRVVFINMFGIHIADTGETANIGYINTGDITDCIFSHCTFSGTNPQWAINFASAGARDTWKDCVFGLTGYGVRGDTATGSAAITTYSPGGAVSKCILPYLNPSIYPSDCFYPADVNAVGFTNYAGGDLSLSNTSVYKNQASDGTDPGCNFTAMNNAVGFAVSGDTTAIQT